METNHSTAGQSQRVDDCWKNLDSGHGLSQHSLGRLMIGPLPFFFCNYEQNQMLNFKPQEIPTLTFF